MALVQSKAKIRPYKQKIVGNRDAKVTEWGRNSAITRGN